VKLNEPLLAWSHASFRVPDLGESSTALYTSYFVAVLILIIAINEWHPLSRGDEATGEKMGRIGKGIASVSLLTIVILGWLMIAHPYIHEYESGRLSVTFLDVGQGDSLVISFPYGSLMIIDAGGRAAYHTRGDSEEDDDLFIEDRIGIAEAAVMPYLWRRGIKRLAWIVASHQDADHVEGFTEIARSFSIGAAMKGDGGTELSPGIFDQAVKNANLPLRIVKRGDLMEIEGVRIEVLSPFGREKDNGMSENDRSLVLRLTFGNHRFLLTGDIEKDAELRLAGSSIDLQADVLKVGHHGSRTSSTQQFLERVKPRHAVISAADPSPYGHPHAEVISRLQASGAKIWRTGSCGAITISTDGYRLNIETFVKCG
jgi:competence protein ComEC